MGRGIKHVILTNRLRDLRSEAGLSQAELAKRSGITRQAVNAIEGQRYAPSAAVAIAIARAVGRSVEDVFQLANGQAVRSSVAENAASPGPVVAGRVGRRIVPWSAGGPHSLIEGFRPSDGFLVSRSAAEFHVAPHVIERTGFVIGCDPSLGILADLVNRQARDCRLVWIPGSSQAALDALRAGSAHVAGIHLREKRHGNYNMTHAARTLRSGGLLVGYAAWQQGFMVRTASDSVSGLERLAGGQLRFVNREQGSGSRTLIDQLLSDARVNAANIAGYGDTVGSHMEVARRVADGSADAGIGLESVARAFGLEFAPLSDASFDLVVPREHEQHPAVEALLHILQSSDLRSALRGLPGYDIQHTGTVHKRFEAAA